VHFTSTCSVVAIGEYIASVQRWWPALTAIVSLAAATAAADEAERVRLVYERGVGASGCPGEEALGEAVTRRLGRPAFSSHAAALLVVLVERDGGGFYGRFSLRRPDRGDSGVRQLHTRAGCDDLVENLSLGVAVLLDPLAQSAPGIEIRPPAVLPSPAGSTAPATAPAAPSAEPAPPPAVPPALASSANPAMAASAETTAGGAQIAPAPPSAPAPELPSSPAVVAVATPAPPRPVWPWAAGAGSALTMGKGVLAPVVRLWLERRRGALSLELGAEAGLDRTDFGVGQVSVAPLLGTLAPCWQPGRLSVCARLSGGALRGEGAGYGTNVSAYLPYFGGGGRIAFTWAGRRLGLRLHLDAEVPFVRAGFTIDGQRAWQTPRLLVQAGADALVHFR
jgi:hypothetical protein